MSQNDIRAAVEEILGPPLLLSYQQVGQLIGQSRTAVYALVREGRLPVVHLGRSARIPRAAVEVFVAELVAEVTT